MIPPEDVRRQFTFDAWANRETLRSILDACAPPPRTLELLAHIIGAQRVWLDRLTRRTPKTPVWPQWAPDQCRLELEQSIEEWSHHLETMDDLALGDVASYLNSKGEAFTSRVSDILTHVIMHGVYHRGQIAAEVRRAGFTPAYTDWIHASRQGLI
jgi:uncharacterized damage-inducible protein DinB